MNIDQSFEAEIQPQNNQGLGNNFDMGVDQQVNNQAAVAQQIDDWRSSLPEELKNSTSLSKFKSVEDLAKSYNSMSDILGKRTADFTEEDWEKFISAQETTRGIPATPEDYYIETKPIAEGLQNTLADNELEYLKGLSYDLGLDKQQAQNLYDGINGALNHILQERQAEAIKNFEEQEDLFKKNWGDALETKKQAVESCLDKFLPEITGKDSQYWAEKIEKLGLDHDFDFCNLLANLGETVSQSQSIGYNNLSPMDASMRLNQIKSDPNLMSIITNKLHPMHKEMSEEFDTLIEIKNQWK